MISLPAHGVGVSFIADMELLLTASRDGRGSPLQCERFKAQEEDQGIEVTILARARFDTPFFCLAFDTISYVIPAVEDTSRGSAYSIYSIYT